jgi:hypothetical protein
VLNRFKKALSIGNISGLFYLCLMILDYLLLMFLIVTYPARNIKKERNFDYEKYKLILSRK